MQRPVIAACVAVLAAASILPLAIAQLAPSAAAVTLHSGFTLDSGVGETLGGGDVIESDDSTVAGTLTSGTYRVTGNDDFGRPWTLTFRDAGAVLTVGLHAGTSASVTVHRESTNCSTTGDAFEVLEAPVVNGSNVITRLAIDFRATCSVSSGTIHGTVRINSPLPARLIRVTSKIAFPDTLQDTTSLVQQIEVRNIGDKAIDLGPASLAGTNSVDFKLTDGCAGAVLPYEDDCTIKVAFAPQSSTAKAATVVLPTDALEGKREVALSGYGLHPLTALPSSIVLDGRDGDTLAKPDRWIDESQIKVTGGPGSIFITAEDWTLSLANSLNEPMQVGTYTDVNQSSGETSFGLSLSRQLQGSCPPGEDVDRVDGIVTILQVPVLDTDGRVLQFAADFEQHCKYRQGFTRGWVRFNSDVPAPTNEQPSFDLEVSSTTVHAGDTLTLTPVVSGVDFYDHVRCSMSLGGSSGSMRVSSDDCAPWTVTVPYSAPGVYRIAGTMSFGDSAAQVNYREDASAVEIAIAPGGVSKPFVSNYPVQSWAIDDLIDDVTPSFGAPLTLRVPANADGCRLMFGFGGEYGWTHQKSNCHDWTLTLAAYEPSSFWGPGGRYRLLAWTGETTWAMDDPELGFVGARWGETSPAGMPQVTGSGGSFASNVPAVFAPAERMSVFYVDEPGITTWEPVVFGAPGGSCRHVITGEMHPVSGTGCGSFSVAPWGSPYNGADEETVELRDLSGRAIAQVTMTIGFALHMAPLSIATSSVSQLGADLDATASTSTGAPTQYEVTVTDLAPGSGTSAVGDDATPLVTNQWRP